MTKQQTFLTDEVERTRKLNKLYNELMYLESYNGKRLNVSFVTESNVLSSFEMSLEMSKTVIAAKIESIVNEINILRINSGLEILVR